jgi:hypothetical protein
MRQLLNHLATFLILACVAFIVYGLVAFVNWDWDAGNWALGARYICVCIVIIGWTIISLIRHLK